MNPYIQYMYSYPHKTAYRPLKGVNLRDYGERLRGGGNGLYLHIPFCETKCGYCNLFSVTGEKTESIDRYLDAVERQIQQYGEILSSVQAEFSSFTIGGGTPLYLTKKQLERVFDMVEKGIALEKNKEIVIETAPNQTTKEKLDLLKSRGVTRVSMGIQSFQEEELRILRRSHSVCRARMALHQLKSYEFPCLNLDFIYGIPGQTEESFLETLKEAESYRPEEIFLYPLYVKHGAGLIKDIREGMVLDPWRAQREYETGARYLVQMGYRQDSMRRFVRQNAGDRTFSDCGFGSCLALGCGGRSYLGNLHFCTPYAITRNDCLKELEQFENTTFSDCGFGSCLALGCGGRSYLGNLHFCTPYAITRNDCLKELEQFENTRDFTQITHGIFLSREEEKARYVIRHLLIRPGILEEEYERCFGTWLLKDFPLLEQWIEQDFLSRNQGFLGLTDKGLKVSDNLGPMLISPDIRKKMEEWEELYGENHDSLQGQFKKL